MLDTTITKQALQQWQESQLAIAKAREIGRQTVVNQIQAGNTYDAQEALQSVALLESLMAFKNVNPTGDSDLVYNAIKESVKTYFDFTKTCSNIKDLHKHVWNTACSVFTEEDRTPYESQKTKQPRWKTKVASVLQDFKKENLVSYNKATRTWTWLK